MIRRKSKGDLEQHEEDPISSRPSALSRPEIELFPNIVNTSPRVFKELYPVNPPYAFVAIALEPGTSKLKYYVIEPTLLDEEVRILNKVKEILLDEIEIDPININIQEAEEYLKGEMQRILKSYKIKLPPESFGKLFYYIKRDFLGYGKIDPIMRDPNVEDISCDGVGIPIYVWHRYYESLPTNVMFETDEELDSFVTRLAYKARRHVSIARPIIDGSLPEGSRVIVTFSREISRRGSTFTIRKFREDPFTIVDMILFKTLSPTMAAYFWLLIESKRSIMIAGATAAGKTTMLNCLAMFIHPEMKVVSIEETPEINLPHENWIPMVARLGVEGIAEITLYDLLKASLRQRPDYLIVGEIRGREAFTFFQSIATGHSGLCTIHAESIEAAIRRLESEPMNVPRTLVIMMDVIALQAKVKIEDRVARRMVEVSEIVGIDPVSKEILLNTVFRWDSKKDDFEFNGRSYIIERIAHLKGIEERELLEEMRRRAAILRWMASKKMRRCIEVCRIIREYYINPERLYRRAVLELEAGG